MINISDRGSWGFEEPDEEPLWENGPGLKRIQSMQLGGRLTMWKVLPPPDPEEAIRDIMIKRQENMLWKEREQKRMQGDDEKQLKDAKKVQMDQDAAGTYKQDPEFLKRVHMEEQYAAQEHDNAHVDRFNDSSVLSMAEEHLAMKERRRKRLRKKGVKGV